MTVLGQFRGACRDFVQGAARTCNGAFQMCYQHPWGAKSHALAITAMPALIGDLLGDDGMAHGRDLVNQPPMQALAVGCQPALAGRLAPSGGLVAFTLLPPGSTFTALGGPTPLVIVLQIGGTPLPLHAPLQATDSSRIGTQLRAQRLEPGLGFPWHDGDAGGPQVQADGVAARHVLGFVVGCACQHQLHDVPISLAVGALCAWAGGLAAHQPGVFDRVRQTMGDHRVIPIDERGKVVVVPQQKATMPFFGRLEHKAQARVVALVLDARKPAATTLEAHPTRLAHADAVQRPVGAGGQCLGQHGIQVLGQPRDPQFSCQLVKSIFREAIALPQRREGCPALLSMCPRDGAGRLPVWISSHLAQAALSRREHSVVELPPDFQVRAHTCCLPCLDEEGQFEQKRRCLLVRGLVLPTCFGAHMPS